MRRLLLLAAAALAAAAPAAPPKHAAPAAARDWSTVVTRLPNGAYLHGDPAAKVKLVEYFSMTCPHCAAFSGESAATLAPLIRSGKLSLELRHAVRDGIDLSASLLARCAGPRGYFPAVADILAKQDEWGPKIESYSQANEAKLKAMAPSAGFADVMNGIGITAIAAAHGAPPARAEACIANPAEQKTLADMAGEAWNTRKIPGTPSFLLNGKLLPETASWAKLKPQLDAALR